MRIGQSQYNQYSTTYCNFCLPRCLAVYLLQQWYESFFRNLNMPLNRWGMVDTIMLHMGQLLQFSNETWFIFSTISFIYIHMSFTFWKGNFICLYYSREIGGGGGGGGTLLGVITQPSKDKVINNLKPSSSRLDPYYNH